MGGHPNYWPKNKVDHNLKQLQNGGLTNSAHDSNSIMHYSFPSWMFIKNENSPCFTEENNNLSLTDQEMMGRAYPFDNEVIAAIDTYRVNNLGSIIAMPNITNNIQKFHIKHLEYYKQIQ